MNKRRMFERFAAPTENLGRETCDLKFALTESNPEEGTFSGVASVFGSIVDAWVPSIIVPGAFTKTLRESSARVKLLHQHDSHEPIGKPSRLQETQAGLEIEAKISQTSRGKDDLILMRDGVIDEMSIGFDPIEGKVEMIPLSKAIEQGIATNPTQWAHRDENEIVRIIREVRLWEVSLVTWGADAMTNIVSVHSMQAARSIVGVSMEELAACIREVHEGKVLSAKNKKLLNECMTALQALLAAAEPPETDSKKEDDKQALTVNAERLNRLRIAQVAFAHAVNR